jgi:hypothetical protein
VIDSDDENQFAQALGFLFSIVLCNYIFMFKKWKIKNKICRAVVATPMQTDARSISIMTDANGYTRIFLMSEIHRPRWRCPRAAAS